MKLQDAVRLNAGTYLVEEIIVTEKTNSLDYYFKKIFTGKDTITISSGLVANYSTNLALKSTTMSVQASSIKPGSTFLMPVLIKTESGYDLTYVSKGYSGLSVVITDPNGTKNTFSEVYPTKPQQAIPALNQRLI